MTNKRNKKQQQQPKRKARASGERQVMAPAATSTITGCSQMSQTSLGNGAVRVKGHELLGSVNGSFKNKTGAIRFLSDMNPACWTNSRLGLIAKCYEKYRVDRMRVTYVPNVGTNFIGTVALFVDTDPLEAYINVSSSSALQSISQNQFVSVGPCWAKQVCEFKRDPADVRLFYASVAQDDDLRETSPGNIYLWTNNDDLLSLGHVYVEYDITFHYPEIEFLEGGVNYVLDHGMTLPAADGDPMTTDRVGGLEANVRSGILQQVRVCSTTQSGGVGIPTFNIDIDGQSRVITTGDLLWAVSTLVGVGTYAWRFYTSRAAADSPGNFIKMKTNVGGAVVSLAGRLLYNN